MPRAAATRTVSVTGGYARRSPRCVWRFGEGDDVSVGSRNKCPAVDLAVVGVNADEGVTWVDSYVTEDKTKTFCIYDAPSPEAIRKVTAANSLPVDRISRVNILDPYSYH